MPFRGLDIPSSFFFSFHVALNFHASLRRRLYCLLHLDVCHIVDTCTKAWHSTTASSIFCFIFICGGASKKYTYVVRVLQPCLLLSNFWTHVIHKLGQTVETKHVYYSTPCLKIVKNVSYHINFRAINGQNVTYRFKYLDSKNTLLAI